MCYLAKEYYPGFDRYDMVTIYGIATSPVIVGKVF
jgi:hypothetical protein